MYAFERHDVGVTGHAEDRPAIDASEGRRLSRLDGDAVEDHLAHARDDVDDEVALADRAAAREDEQIVAGRGIDGRAQSVQIVGGRRVDDRHAAVGADDGGEGELVDVVQLAGPERFAGRDDLVAGRQNRDARPGEDVDLGQPHGGERADAARRQHVARREERLA